MLEMKGFRRAKGQLFIFLDDDVILLSNGFIQAHVDAFNDPAVGGVTGRHIERAVKMNSWRTACHVLGTDERSSISLVLGEKKFVLVRAPT